MDQVFDAQFQAMRSAFARDGVGIEIAYTPDGRPDYIYVTGRLLVRVNNQDDKKNDIIRRIQGVLPGTALVGSHEQPTSDLLRVLSIEHLTNGQLTVPEALDQLDAEFDRGKDPGKDRDEEKRPTAPGDSALYSALHVFYLCDNGDPAATGRLCPADEPEVPCCCCAVDGDCPPCPPAAPGSAGAGVLIGICDTGLLADIAGFPWLDQVTGEIDPLGPLLAPVPPIPAGLHAIPQYTGHGTFAAGVARGQAPGAGIYVSNHILTGGGILEHVLVQRLEEMLLHDPVPQVVNLSAGGYTRRNFKPLSFTAFDNGGVTLIAAAGNDATSRPFWPAAFDWVVGVGALGADQRDRAWFSNYGRWVNVYTLGEGLVNAYATGVYTYQEPPKRLARQIFNGMARWSGTSFAAPLVAGLIAAQMTNAGASAADATAAVLTQAANQAIEGVGPALFPWHP